VATVPTIQSGWARNIHDGLAKIEVPQALGPGNVGFSGRNAAE
jgi:hypothetical protein